MVIDQLRRLRDSEPFRPFRICMADGTEFTIQTPKDLILTRGGDVALVDEKDVLHILNHIQISRASLDRVRRRRVGASS